MDASGIDQVMVFPSTFVRMPLVKNADAARICATAYNDWVNDYCAADRKRLYPCAVLPIQGRGLFGPGAPARGQAGLQVRGGPPGPRQ